MHKRAIRAACGTTALAAGLLSGVGAMTAAQAAPLQVVVSVPCSTVALVGAINTANTSTIPSVLDLASKCVYALTGANNSSPTQGDNGLPIITRNVTLVGDGTSAIVRASTAKFRILEVAGSGGNSASLTVSGVALEDGRVSGFFGNAGRGGCVLATYTGTVPTSSFLTLSHSQVADCTAVSGGGIYVGSRGTFAIGNSKVDDNTAVSGGGIFLDSSTGAVIGASFIKNNTALLGTGGGLRNEGDAKLTGAIIVGNHASVAGGGIYNTGDLFVGASLLTQDSSLSGGGIYATHSSDMHVAASTMQLNTALLDGGAIANNGDALLQNSFVSQNTAPVGGGIWEGPFATMLNLSSLIFGNTLNNCRPLLSVPFCVN